jgi:hypothetical protein
MATIEEQNKSRELAAGTKEIVSDSRKWQIDDLTLAGIDSFATAMALAEEMGGGAVEDSDSYGDGFEGLETKEKTRLVGVPLVFVSWSFANGDFGDDPFVVVWCVTEKGDKYRFTDGSSGLARQLFDVSKTRIQTNHPSPYAGLAVRKGLVQSRPYTYIDAKGQEQPGSPIFRF